MIRITRIIPKDIVFGLLDNPDIAKFQLDCGTNKSIKNEFVCRVSIYLKVPFHDFQNIPKTLREIHKTHVFLSNSNRNFVATLDLAWDMGYIRARHLKKLRKIEEEESVHFNIPKYFYKLIDKYEKEQI